MNQIVPLFRNDTALHMGAESTLGYIDLPIQREHITGFPKMEATGIKGVLVDALKGREWSECLFGSSDGTKAGNLRIRDGRLLLFPIKSDVGFCWITCPFVLKRFIGECKVNANLKDILKQIEEKVTGNTVVVEKCNTNRIVLGDFSYETQKGEEISQLRKVIGNILEEEWLKNIPIVIVNDDAFSYFVEMNTEVRTRNVIDNDTGTAKNLFTVEYLPEESVLYSVFEYPKREENVVKGLRKEIKNSEHFQFGGEESIGKGITKVNIMNKEERNETVKNGTEKISK